MKYIIIFIFCWYYSVSAIGQTPVIGMLCPDLPLSKSINGKLPQTHINGLRGKYIIIDNWATWCAPCVGGLEHMQGLADSFPNLQFIMVSQEPKQVQKEFFGQHPIGKKIKLPAIAEDSIIRRTFPYITIPHLIWINDKGIIDAITGKEELTASNIFKWMNKEKIKLAVKQDALDFNAFSNIPLVFNDYNTNKEQLLVNSYLSREHKGMSSVLNQSRKTDSILKVRVTNHILFDLYVTAYQKGVGYWPLPRVVAECSNPERFGYNKNKKGNIYCYDLIVANLHASSYENLYKFMQDDLNRYFGVTSSIQKRELPCLVIRKLNDTVKLKNDITQKPKLLLTDNYFQCNKVPFSSLVSKYCNKMPWVIVNETGIEENFNLDIPLGKKNFTLDKAKEIGLQLGLSITEEKRVMDAIVIRDP